MGLVGVRVADGRDHRDLALGVELGQRCERRVPAQARVLGEGLAVGRRQRQLWAEGRVLRVPGRHRQGVGTAVEEDREQHRAGRALRAGDALLEEAERSLLAP